MVSYQNSDFSDNTGWIKPNDCNILLCSQYFSKWNKYSKGSALKVNTPMKVRMSLKRIPHFDMVHIY